MEPAYYIAHARVKVAEARAQLNSVQINEKAFEDGHISTMTSVDGAMESLDVVVDFLNILRTQIPKRDGNAY